MNIASSNPAMTVSAIFDGEYQWIESKYPGGYEVSKIELDRVSSEERPFDTSYYIMGSGLVNGESYQDSVLTLLSVYDLKPVCHQNKIMLSGPLNIEQFTKYLKSKKHPGSVEFKVNKYSATFGFTQFVFNKNSMTLIRYSLGADKNPDFYSVNFENITFNQGLNPEDFKFVPPAGVVVTDITDALLESLEGYC